MPESTDRPLCQCHGEPMWVGGKGQDWICSVRGRERGRRYREQHREERQAYNLAWKQANPDKVAAQQSKKYWRDPEKYKAASRAWQERRVEISVPIPGAHYMTAHNNHRRVLPRECALADESCKGYLEAALRRDAPPERLLESSEGLYSLDVQDYVRLCRSHHSRYDHGKVEL